MPTPAATALHLARGVLAGVIVSVLIAVAIAWASLVLAYVTDWPTSFFITALGALGYLSAGAASRLRAA
jgi:zinc/manganese transport system permease protein